uniref:Uncharacterized protein n=1 Tax=Octopus bimaculoides TaxID=37653 RepID=A0A0L8FW09_OCTBM
MHCKQYLPLCIVCNIHSCAPSVIVSYVHHLQHLLYAVCAIPAVQYVCAASKSYAIFTCNIRALGATSNLFILYNSCTYSYRVSIIFHTTSVAMASTLA